MERGRNYLDKWFDQSKFNDLKYIYSFYKRNNGLFFTLSDYSDFIIGNKYGWELWDEFWEMVKKDIQNNIQDGLLLK